MLTPGPDLRAACAAAVDRPARAAGSPRPPADACGRRSGGATTCSTPAAQEVFRAAGAFLGGFNARRARGNGRTRRRHRRSTSCSRRAWSGAGSTAAGSSCSSWSARSRSTELARTGDLGRVRGSPPRATSPRRRLGQPSERRRRRPRPARARRRSWPTTRTSAPRSRTRSRLATRQPATALALGMRPLWFAGMLATGGPGAGRSAARTVLDPARARDRAAARGLVRGGLQPVACRRGRDGWRIVRRSSVIRRRSRRRTGNLFGRAMNARDRDEMRRMRPMLLELLTPEASAAGARVDALLPRARRVHRRPLRRRLRARRAERGERATSWGTSTCSRPRSATRLLGGVSPRPGDRSAAPWPRCSSSMRQVSVQPLAAFALWFVARYAAARGARYLRAVARPRRTDRRSASTPSCGPRASCATSASSLLGIAERGTLLDGAPPLDHAAALDRGRRVARDARPLRVRGAGSGRRAHVHGRLRAFVHHASHCPRAAPVLHRANAHFVAGGI